MNDKIVTLDVFQIEAEALLARDALLENGIKAEVVGHNLNMIPYLAAANSVELKVFASDIDRAKEILASLSDFQPGEIDE